MQQSFFVLAMVLSCWALFSAQPAIAQIELFNLTGEAGDEGEERELETDRDAFTPATSVAGTALTIVESSYSFIDHRRVAETHSFPELLVRHGVNEWLELRIGWNYEVGGTGDIVSGNEDDPGNNGEIERESQLLYGFKAMLTEQDGWTPRSALIVQGYTPTLGEAPETDIVAAYVFGWAIGERWRLDSSLRYGTEHTAEDAFNVWAPSIVLRMAINEQWHAHVEYFGIFSTGAENNEGRNLVSPGMHYNLTEDLELGARVGWGLNDDAPNFFSNVGIGWRF